MKARINALLLFTFLGLLTPKLYAPNDEPTTTPFLHVDGDNTTLPANYPDASKGDFGAEELVAQNNDDEVNYPGVGVPSNIADYDGDGVPGFADGINKFGNGHANACEKFAPLIIAIPAYQNSSSVRFIFRYSSSDPDQMTSEDMGDYSNYTLPNDHPLRIWTKDGDAIRDPRSAHASGDFVQADQAYTMAQLGWQAGPNNIIKLYIEALVPSDWSQSTSVTVEFYPDGTSSPGTMCNDRIKVRPFTVGDNLEFAL